MSEKKVLWDNVIPNTVVIRGKPHAGGESGSEDLVLQRVPGVDYALYVIEFGRNKLFPNQTNGSQTNGSNGKQPKSQS